MYICTPLNTDNIIHYFHVHISNLNIFFLFYRLAIRYTHYKKDIYFYFFIVINSHLLNAILSRFTHMWRLKNIHPFFITVKLISLFICL